jgi:hypothetical protein
MLTILMQALILCFVTLIRCLLLQRAVSFTMKSPRFSFVSSARYYPARTFVDRIPHVSRLQRCAITGSWLYKSLDQHARKRTRAGRCHLELQ